MLKLNYIIPQRRAELVRNRIVEILTAELENQALNYVPECETKVFGERFTPLDQNELSVVNVSLFKITSDNKHQGSKDCECQFNIDVFCRAKSKEDMPGVIRMGDSLAQLKMQRLTECIDYILEDPQFRNLLFPIPFISRVWVSDVTFFEQDPAEGSNVSVGRLIFHVIVNETNKLLEGNLIESIYTDLKFNQTENGIEYIWQANQI